MGGLGDTHLVFFICWQMLGQVALEAQVGEVALVLLGGEGGSSLHKNLRNH